MAFQIANMETSLCFSTPNVDCNKDVTSGCRGQVEIPSISFKHTKHCFFQWDPFFQLFGSSESNLRPMETKNLGLPNAASSSLDTLSFMKQQTLLFGIFVYQCAARGNNSIQNLSIEVFRGNSNTSVPLFLPDSFQYC